MPADAFFAIDKVPHKSIEIGDWRSVSFASGWLYGELVNLEEQCVKLGTVAKVGPHGRRIRDAYKKSTVSSGKRAIWDHKSDYVRSMATDTDTYVVEKDGKQPRAEKYWGMRQKLFVGTRIRLNTMRMLSICTETEALGSAFVPIGASSEEYEKAICVWLNSTLGILGFFGNREVNKGLSYAEFSLEAQQSLPIPDLSDKQAKQLADVYDKHSGNEMLPIKDLNDCRTRDALDLAVSNVVGQELNFSYESIKAIRKGLSDEPAISNEQMGEGSKPL